MVKHLVSLFRRYTELDSSLSEHFTVSVHVNSPYQHSDAKTAYFCFDKGYTQVTYFYVMKCPEDGLIFVQAICPAI